MKRPMNNVEAADYQEAREDRGEFKCKFCGERGARKHGDIYECYKCYFGYNRKEVINA